MSVLNTIILRGTAAKILRDSAEEKRAGRAASVTVLNAVENRESGALRAEVEGSSSTYRVEVGDLRRGRYRAFRCECADHTQRGTLCKHGVAVLDRFLAEKREDFKAVRRLERLG
jgi:uncharacterized Zn finger protein